MHDPVHIAPCKMSNKEWVVPIDHPDYIADANLAFTGLFLDYRTWISSEQQGMIHFRAPGTEDLQRSH